MEKEKTAVSIAIEKIPDLIELHVTDEGASFEFINPYKLAVLLQELKATVEREQIITEMMSGFSWEFGEARVRAQAEKKYNDKYGEA